MTNTLRESKKLIAALRNAQDGVAIETRLKTDEQVIARVTDGIYRQPASAFRELIANAYDADARSVTIKTDVPRFKRITIEDDGNGMTEEVLVNLLHHIGGSAKRRELGTELGVALADNPLLSPGGRCLIGKIGIGLFSVSQLTRTFHIITKTKGSSERLIASVAMRQFDGSSDEVEFESGKVKLWKEAASNTEGHGTTIVLDGIRDSARRTLSSAGLWDSLKQAKENEPDSQQLLPVPKYFVGSAEFRDSLELLADIPGHYSHHVPWEQQDASLVKFSKLVQSVWDEAKKGNSNARLDSIFDIYLRIVWQLSLSVPLQYVDSHPFDEDPLNWEGVFKLSNKQKESPQRVELLENNRARDQLGLQEITDGASFSVMFDGLELRRPLRFKGLPKSQSRIDKPIMFFGRCEEDFANQPKEVSAGPLKFEAYLMWAPKILPVDHQGVLIRINGASGTLFDTGFMNYQTAEIVRMRQISCEIFVHQGLEAALNIDRESLNQAHPHTVFLAQWLHNALRQVTSTQKRLAANIRSEQREVQQDARVSRLSRIVDEVRRKVAGENGDALPTVFIGPSTLESIASADFIIDSAELESGGTAQGRDTVQRSARDAYVKSRTEAIGNVLAAYGLFDHLDENQRVTLLRAIYEILSDEVEN